jgi:hypothetical protein
MPRVIISTARLKPLKVVWSNRGSKGKAKFNIIVALDAHRSSGAMGGADVFPMATGPAPAPHRLDSAKRCLTRAGFYADAGL